MQASNGQISQLSIIIPTKNRVQILAQLIESIKRLDGIQNHRPEIIVADNGSEDGTYAFVRSVAIDFPAPVRIINVPRRGKSAAINDAVKSSSGDALAFLDDDVMVDRAWLTAVVEFFRMGNYRIGQGMIRLARPEGDDPEILRLIDRYRTIPRLEHEPGLKTVHSLNGSNFFASRGAFNRIGGFDERLGPGASGTSEDVDFARRLTRAQITIGYAPRAIVHHRVDRRRLTDEYFRECHRRQGASRFLIRRQTSAAIVLDLARTALQFGYYSLTRQERPRYRSKGRIYHYLGMLEAKQNRRGEDQAVMTESVMDPTSPTG
jgi:glycosyltransferase involved in cell wall biosynthesis